MNKHLFAKKAKRFIKTILLVAGLSALIFGGIKGFQFFYKKNDSFRNSIQYAQEDDPQFFYNNLCLDYEHSPNKYINLYNYSTFGEIPQAPIINCSSDSENYLNAFANYNFSELMNLSEINYSNNLSSIAYDYFKDSNLTQDQWFNFCSNFMLEFCKNSKQNFYCEEQETGYKIYFSFTESQLYTAILQTLNSIKENNTILLVRNGLASTEKEAIDNIEKLYNKIKSVAETSSEKTNILYSITFNKKGDLLSSELSYDSLNESYSVSSKFIDIKESNLYKYNYCIYRYGNPIIDISLEFDTDDQSQGKGTLKTYNSETFSSQIDSSFEFLNYIPSNIFF